MSSFVELNYDEAHDFVEKNSRRGYFWEGWDVVRWVKNPNGFSSKNGAFRNGTWGITYRSPVQKNGKWRVKNV